MNKEVWKFLERAQRALSAAESLLGGGYLSDAASKSYYAMFYAAQAALRAEGIEVIKHSAVESFFGRHLAKTGRVDTIYHRLLIDARKLRETADYSLEEEVSESVARQTLEDGKAFVNVIKTLLADSPRP
jgi:uncharacterized protein (UPF0332 family)